MKTVAREVVREKAPGHKVRWSDGSFDILQSIRANACLALKGEFLMLNVENNQYNEWDIDVAKRIACAVTAYQSGQAYETLWEQYADQTADIGTFWLSMAKQIREHLPHKPK